jgi:hypothetical protein
MVPDVASRRSNGTQSPIASALVELAACPLCHSEDPTLTNAAVIGGAGWRCARCGQSWDALRLATAAAYAAWQCGRASASSQERTL